MSDSLYVRSRDEAMPLVAVLSRKLDPGVDLVMAFDRAGELGVAVPLDPGTTLTEVVELMTAIALPGEQLLLVSNRTGEDPADRPSDEFDWEEMSGIARANDVVLLDWFVTCGTTAFSLAEFAPTPAAWAR